MSEAATGLLAVWMDPSPELEDDLNRWYNEEHLIDRMAFPGFLRARRFVSVGEGPKYAALYDLADGAMSSESYLKARADPTEWTKKVTSALTTNIRNEYSLMKSIGEAPASTPPYLLMVCLETDDEHDAELNDWYDNEHLAALQSVPGCHTARRYRATDLTPGFPRNLAIYELDAPEVRTSDAWHKAADTEWTLQMREHFLPNRTSTMGQLIKAVDRTG